MRLIFLKRPGGAVAHRGDVYHPGAPAPMKGRHDPRTRHPLRRRPAGVKPSFSVRVDLLTSGGAEFMAHGGSGDSIYEALRDVFDTSVRQLEAAVRHH
jgi:hypothetical protein